jgi:hypothetical protein
MDIEFRLNETACAGDGGSSSVESAAPEHEIDVVNGEATKTISEALALRKELNRITEEAMRIHNLKEKIEDPESDYNKARYKLQKWTNGGSPNADGGTDGKKGEPSSYEAWRAGINEKKQKARLEQEKSDRESPFASPKHTTQPRETLDDQEDQFLSYWIDKYGEKPLKESTKNLDSFLNWYNSAFGV